MLLRVLARAGLPKVRFHDLRHTFATMALQNGVDVKTLSAMLVHVSAATTLDIYTHITDDMRLTAAANIDRSIGKAAPQEETLEPGQETAPATEERPRMTDFKPYVGRKRRSGTGCVSEINDHLFEGRYSPKWPDGKKHARNIYAHTRGTGIASSRVRRKRKSQKRTSKKNPPARVPNNRYPCRWTFVSK